MQLTPTATVDDLAPDAAHRRRPVGTLLAWLHPRDARLAARTVSVLCAVGLAVTVATLPLGVNDGSELNGVAIALAGVAWSSRP